MCAVAHLCLCVRVCGCAFPDQRVCVSVCASLCMRSCVLSVLIVAVAAAARVAAATVVAAATAAEIAVVMEAVEDVLGREMKLQEFFDFLDVYPHVFRPDMFKIFNYLKRQKKRNKELKVLIYTNNIGPKSWVMNRTDKPVFCPVWLSARVVCLKSLSNERISA